MPALDPAQRRQLLADRVQMAVADGWRVESQADFRAVLVKGGNRTRHWLHLILTLLTLLLYAIVWFLVAAKNRHQRWMVLSVNEDGHIKAESGVRAWRA